MLEPVFVLEPWLGSDGKCDCTMICIVMLIATCDFYIRCYGVYDVRNRLSVLYFEHGYT